MGLGRDMKVQIQGSEMPLALLIMLLTSGLQDDYIAMCHLWQFTLTFHLKYLHF